MVSDDIFKFLKEKVALFRDFPEERLTELLNDSQVITFEPNEAVIEFGEEGHFLGVLLDGEAELSITDDCGEKHVLDAIGPGGLFGVPSLMTGNKTMTDVIGRTLCQALLIPQKLFTSIIATYPPAVLHLSKILVDRLKIFSYEGKGQELASAALKRSQDPYGFKLQTERPMKILVINCGSSSLKYNLFDTADEKQNARGDVERIGQEGTLHRFSSARGEFKWELPRTDHREAFAEMFRALTSPESGVITSPAEIAAVGHRVVHGGDKYNHSVLINEEVIEVVERASAFAPLHNPLNLIGIREAMKLFPHAPQVAVFDTAFHQTIPAYAYLYGLPYEYFEKKGIRRYGFHGTSHQYVALKVAEHLKRPYNQLSTIICHLGNGASICAVDHGRSIDTSMGFTPLEGLVMGTRSGDLDPGVILHLMEAEGLDHRGLHELLNKTGGLKGLSGLSNDMREVEAAANEGDHRAILAIRTFAYRVRKYIGAYVAAMDGVDILAFTGGIGQGSVGVRSLACQGLKRIGIHVDERKNREVRGFDRICDISAEDSQVKVLVVPTDEERMIARQTLRVLDRSHVAGILKNQTLTEIPIEISAHHVHLSPAHVEALFGPGHQLTPWQDLSQPGQFACQERVNLIGPKGRVENVRVLGPARKQTQVEIALTEQYKLGVQAPIRESGDLDHTPGLTVEANNGAMTISQGVICALRHIHMSPEEALSFGLKDKDVVKVRVPGERELIFGDVLVRVSPNFRLAMHIDTDEGNAASIPTGASGYIDGLQSRR
ncbi:MAG: acetate/propionate family kinase [Thermodesulfobacteriota bacterium]